MVISTKPVIIATTHPDLFAIPTNPGPAQDPDAIATASSAINIADIYKVYTRQSNVYLEFIAAK